MNGAGRCRLCGSEKVAARFPDSALDLMLCAECGTLFRPLELGADRLRELYDEDYYLKTWPGSLGRFFQDFDPDKHHKTRFFIRQLAEFERLMGRPGRLLDVGCANGVFVWLAKERGWEAEGVEITTVEGLMRGEELGPVQQAFAEKDGFQCGYCTSGQVVAVEGLLRAQPSPSIDDITLGVSGNICRCGAYPFIFKAAQRAAELKQRERS